MPGVTDNRPLLLVEGPDDKWVVINLWKRVTRSEPPFNVIELGGIDRLLEAVTDHEEDKPLNLAGSRDIDKILADVKQRVRIRGEDTENTRWGVVLDADTSGIGQGLVKRWTSIADILREGGYADVPDVPAMDGTIIGQTERQTVGIWIMPDNLHDGTIEDFLQDFIDQDDPLYGHANDAVRSAPDHPARFREVERKKAELHTWLALQSPPGRPYGLAVDHGAFNTGGSLALRFVEWLRRLVENPSVTRSS